MIRLFKGDTTRGNVLMYNGNYILDDIRIKDQITEEFNGNFEYEITVRIDKSYPKELYDLLIEGSILVVDDEEGDEVFRIASVRKNKRDMQIYARQITIADTLTLWCEDLMPENQNGQGALEWILSKAKGKKEILVSSNIKKVSTARYEYCTVYQAYFDKENSFLERWGGEVKRKQYNLYINERIGRDTGMQIRSRKNLTGFEIKTNIDSLCTVIYPKGYDRLKADPVYSPLLNNYPREYYREIKYSDVKVQSENDSEGFATEREAQEELKRLAELEFSEKHIDQIQAEYNIKYVDLSRTEEYKEYAPTEYAMIGDIVNVIEDTYNTNVKVRVTRRVYEPYRKRRIETTLSNKDIKSKPPTISDIIAELDKVQEEGQKGLSEYVNAMINSGLKDSYVVLKPNELLIMDSKDINTAVNVTRYNKNGLGFSTTGYYGNYEYGFTIDGKLNADRIQTGVLTAILIQSMDGSCSINLETGEVNFAKGIIRGNNCSFNLNNGELKTFKTDIITGEKRDVIFREGRMESDSHFDIEAKIGFGAVAYNNTTSIQSMLSLGSQLVANSKNEMIFSSPRYQFWDRGGNSNRFDIQASNVSFDGGGNVLVTGTLSVLGNKNCIQKTKEFFDVPFYANEDINSLLTKTPVNEYYTTKLHETGAYKCIIPISQMIRECINTDLEYNVWLTKYGAGDIWISNTYPGYFVVESDRPIKFKYKLEGVRLGFEDNNEQMVYNKIEAKKYKRKEKK